jgi:hypothetical protein
MSNDKVIFTSCDKLDWINGQYVVAAPNAAVSAEWIVGGANSVQDANSGYEFWIFDPNGSYSFRQFPQPQRQRRLRPGQRYPRLPHEVEQLGGFHPGACQRADERACTCPCERLER